MVTMDICRCAGDLRDLIHSMKISSRPCFSAEDYDNPRLPLDFFEFPCFLLRSEVERYSRGCADVALAQERG